MAPDPAAPELSIIVTIVDGGQVLERCLQALADQRTEAVLEVLVPYDHISAETAALAPRFPAFRFIDLGEILGGTIPRDDLALHAFFDTRRTGALKVARGDLIGIIEDRGIPAPDWAAEMIRLHRENPHGVIGGAVRNGVDKLKNWAIFFCDFGRYQPPLSAENPEYVTDTNIVYKRDAILGVRDLWDESYVEATVNWELRRRNVGLLLSDRPVTVQHRTPPGLGAMASERFHWARMFGQTRGREIGRMARLKLCAAMPILPFLLLWRHFRRQVAKGHDVGHFLAAAPLTLFLLVNWSAGEFMGYLEARPDKAS